MVFVELLISAWHPHQIITIILTEGSSKLIKISYFENDWWICHWIIKCVLINVHNFSIKVQIENQILSSNQFLVPAGNITIIDTEVWN